jgi:hypothetical protein
MAMAVQPLEGAKPFLNQERVALLVNPWRE